MIDNNATVFRGLRVMTFALLAIAVIGASPEATGGEVRVGVLTFGTVAWELDVIKAHQLDEAEGVTVTVTGHPGNAASQVALLGRAVDVIAGDFFWVSRMRADGESFTFVPHSMAVGAIMVRDDSGITKLDDLRGKKLGVAGGPIDSGWLLFQAYTRQEIGVSAADLVEPQFAAPPLLNVSILKGDFPAVLNFWHYNARLKAAGLQVLTTTAEQLKALGIDSPVPVIGWIFRQDWAAENPDLIQGFLRASVAAKQILLASDEEWQRLRPRMKADDEATFLALRESYRAGIPRSYGPREVATAEKTFLILAEIGGAKLVGGNTALSPGTLWDGFRF